MLVTSINIRDAQFSDLDAINHLLRLSKAHWGYDEQFMNAFMQHESVTSEEIQQNTIKLFFDNDKFIGFYAFAINKEDPIPLYLDSFFIHPDYIGQGIGKFMWQHCVKFAASINQNQFSLWSDPNATSFYEKMGCVQVGQRESSVQKGRFTPILVYKLEPLQNKIQLSS
jgi:streptomycin 6-kinase